MTARARSVRAKARISEARMGPGFTTFSLRGLPGLALDPFLNFDDFRMSQPTFPPHPHAGFSAVTVMFEDSPGAFINRDSLGDRSRIGPGAVHWTQAARGMMHEEIPEAPGTVCHGLQMFVNLRAEHKALAPRAFHVDAGEVPVVLPGAGVRVRVLAGSFADASAPLTQLLTPILLLDVHLAAGARVRIPVEAAWSCFALALTGAGEAGAGAQLMAHDAVGFDGDGDAVELAAGQQGLQVLLAAGKPIGEPVVFGGPFVMTGRADLDAAVERYHRGEMGHLAPSF